MSTSQFTMITLGRPALKPLSFKMDSSTTSKGFMSPLSPTDLSMRPATMFVDSSPQKLEIEIKKELAYNLSPVGSPGDLDIKADVGSPMQVCSPKSIDSRQRQKSQDELCLVCGDRASGYHYNALACEGCKGFFRRSITQSKSSKYLCKYGDNCEIDMYMRRKCQACRLKKCYTVGMRSDCVVPEEQCRKKRQEKKDNQTSLSPIAVALSPALATTNQTISPYPIPELEFLMDTTNLSFCHKRLKPEQEELINRLVYFQEEFEQPSEEDLKKVYHVPLDINSSDIDESESLFRHITEITILTVQLIVQFSRHLPGFQTLNRSDQVILLKACSSEVMMIRASRRYDIQSDSIVFATNHPFTRDHYVKAGLDNEALFQFCRRMSKMKVDNAEYGLLTAITIFSGRRNLCDPHRVEKILEIYVDALQAYMQVNRRKQPMVALAKLLSILADLRSLGNNNSRQCFDLKLMANRKLPQFLAEIWDIV